MKLSIVATLYKSAPHITEFHQRASAAAKELVSEDYEIVLVNDGSPDNSLDLQAVAIFVVAGFLFIAFKFFVFKNMNVSNVDKL